MNNEKDKWTIITGACGGLGKAFCLALAKKGCNLFITGTNEQRTNDWANELAKKFPQIKVDYAVCNLSNEDHRKRVFEILKEKNIILNRLINNAGYIAEGGLLDFSDEQVLEIIKVNCEGTVDMTQKFIKAFGGGTEILSVSSLGAFYPMPYMSVYSATKRMIVNLMVALREEVKEQKIKVSTLCPGGIPTTEAMKQAIKSQGLGGKLSSASPEYIAEYALKKLSKNKAIIIPKMFNRFLKVAGKPLSEVMIAKAIGNRWKKANSKRKLAD